MPAHYIDGKGHKSDNRNYLINPMMPLHIYGLRRGPHTHRRTHLHTYLHESDFKKPGTRWPHNDTY